VNTAVLGLFLISLVIYLSAEAGSGATYLQMHSIIVVVGGTIALTILMSPWKGLVNLYYELKDMMVANLEVSALKEELIAISKDRLSGKKSKHPLLRYASEQWESGIRSDLFIALLSQRRSELQLQSTEAVQLLKNLSKYPPSLGMIGTVMGMVSVFSALDTNKSQIGMFLAIAMTATFYGLLVANGLIAPLADRLQAQSVSKKRQLEAMYQVILLVNRDESESLIEDEIEVKSETRSEIAA